MVKSGGPGRVGRRQKCGSCPDVGSAHQLPPPEAVGLEKTLVLGVGFGSVLNLIISGGGGPCADYSCLVRFVLLLFNIVSMPGRGSEKPLLPSPQ